MSRKFLITGGEGFIGRNIKNYIVSKGDFAYTLDISGDPDYRVSVTDLNSLIDIKEDFDGVFHLAAVTSPPQFEDNPLAGFEVNVNGTLNVLEFARQKNIKRVVLASSSATYGNAVRMSTEENFPKSYGNIYPITKMVGEYLARYYSDQKGIECISLRYFNAYGPGENTKSQYASVVWRFVKALSKGERAVIYGDGKQKRDFIYVLDTARASFLAMLHGKSGESYNIGTGVSTTFNDIYTIVKKEMRSALEPDYIPNPLKNYQYFTQAEMTKTKGDLGFTPEYDLRSGIRSMLQNDIRSI